MRTLDHIKRIKKLGGYSALILVVIVQPGMVYGLSQAQRDIFDRGILYFNSDQSSDLCDLNGGISIGLGSDIVPEPYNTIFSAAASAYDTNPQFIAALFLTENRNSWPDPNGPWRSSKVGPTWPDGVVGARGPFQFEYPTWGSYKVDGDRLNGEDPDNIYDAAYSAAYMLQRGRVTVKSPLGSIDTPFKPGTFLEFGAKYNWGPGNMQQNHITATSSLTAPGVPKETSEYLSNLYSLVSSGFTKSGKPGYPDPAIDTTSTTTTTPVVHSCTAGVVAGNIAQTAINLSWPESHKPALEATSAYLDAINLYLRQARASSGGADCAAFVSVVMHASQADTSYPVGPTSEQERYVRANSDRYDVLTDIQSTKDLLPGDILIVNQGAGTGAAGHTMIYVGTQTGGNEASASQGDRMPSIGTLTSLDDEQGRGHYIVARMKG